MFSFIRKIVLPARDSCSPEYSFLVKFISTDSKTHNSFAISYLINTCGVSQEKAISCSKKGVCFKSSENPNSVLAYLRDNGFSNTQISKFIGKYPLLLLSSVDKNLKPKFEFFKSQGITGSDFAEVLCQDQHVLGASLENRIIPYFGIIRSLVHTDAQLLALLKRSSKVLTQDPRRRLIPNMSLLQTEGAPADNIAKLLVAHTRAFLISNSRFREIVEKVKKMKFEPLQFMFLEAVRALASMTRSSWEAKFKVYRIWGLSEDEVHFMFRKNPCCLMISEKNIMSTMDFLVEEMGYTPSSIAQQPIVLLYSLKRRIIPRCSVFQILKEKDLVGDKLSLYSLLKPTEEVFLKRYVIKFEKEVPELLTTYLEKGR